MRVCARWRVHVAKISSSSSYVCIHALPTWDAYACARIVHTHKHNNIHIIAYIPVYMCTHKFEIAWLHISDNPKPQHCLCRQSLLSDAVYFSSTPLWASYFCNKELEISLNFFKIWILWSRKAFLQETQAETCCLSHSQEKDFILRKAFISHLEDTFGSPCHKEGAFCLGYREKWQCRGFILIWRSYWVCD